MKAQKIVILFTFILLTAWNQNVQGQDKITASLQDIILTAQSDSPDLLLAETRKENASWVYVSAQSLFKPQLSLNANLPSLNRSISSIPLPDGTESFVNRAFMRNSIGISLSQDLSTTGGSFFVGTSLDRLDQFETDIIPGSVTYLSTPITIGFNQPILRFNEFKWQKERAELIYESSKKSYVEEKGVVSFNAMNSFFDLYITTINLEEATRNMDYLDEIAENASNRYNAGRISETDLLQIQLSARNAAGNVAQLNLDMQNKTELLRDFLGITKEVTFDLTEPEPLADYLVNTEEALSYAKENRSATENFRLQLREAKTDLERAKKNNGPSINVNGSLGFTQSDNTFTDAYSNLLGQQGLGVSLNVPIATFGRAKAQREIAKSNLELTELQVKQNEVSFEREIIISVEQFKLIRNQLDLAKDALEIAEKRLDLAKKRFDVGKVEVTDLNIAIQEEISTRQQYYTTLWSLWQAHYTLRNLTLFDFENGVVLN